MSSLVLSYSQIKTWKQCRKKWHYKYMEGLEPIQRIQKVEIGKYGHHLLEAYYKGADLEQVSQEYWDEKTKDMFQEEEEPFIEVREQSEDLVKRYINNYGRENEWEIQAVEEKFKVNIPTHKGNLSRNYLRGILDLIVQDETGELWLVDHKFTSIDLDKYEDGLVLDEQANYYLWALRELLQVDGIAGIIFNLVKTKAPTIPKVLKAGGLSKAKNIDTDYDTYVKAIKDNNLDAEDYRDILEHIKEVDKKFFKRHYVYRTKHEVDLIGKELYSICQDIRRGIIYPNAGGYYNNDPFRELLIMERKGADTEFYKEQNFIKK